MDATDSLIQRDRPNITKGQTKHHKVLDYLDSGEQCQSDETSKIFESVAEFV